MNILLITLDQFRGDCLASAGHPLVETPNLDALGAEGIRLARHYSQATPCGPGRACLYTGMYQMNNRVVANGSPLDDRFDNVARAGRRAGYAPALFGYTDQGVDPRLVDGPDDPRLSDYEGVLPGFDCVLDLAGFMRPWLDWLREQGHDVPNDIEHALATCGDRPAEVSISAFLTERALAWIDDQDGPWFAHLSYLRPHPPYAAAGRWATHYDPAAVGLPIPTEVFHPLHEWAMGLGIVNAPDDEDELRWMRSQYYGMVSEVDEQLGRVWDHLRATGAWDDTFIVVTADHAEMLGDHGLQQKLGYWEQSHHILGFVRDPRHPEAHGTVVDRFTENIDVLPTLCEAMGLDIPAQCDGLPLTPLVQGEEPPWWRTAAHWEFDWRDNFIREKPTNWPWDRRLEKNNLAVLRTDEHAYVQFATGEWLCFDLVVDPTWRTTTEDPAVVLPLAQQMLTWRAEHADRELADMLLSRGGVGRWPTLPDGWDLRKVGANTPRR